LPGYTDDHGGDREYGDLYHPETAPDDKAWLSKDTVNQQNWLASIIELIDILNLVFQE